ncbi:hypothetical protein BB560_000025 [Smittium megazygosporum]|uniref:Uncharacterized protein n=1 Tax=Smittium megazygosporum TaxID=133381 RepID=A0A2T9ZLM5_9FUNG|nr:hypothetical protein BB560_000025 [Smittium megazygosporum]
MDLETYIKDDKFIPYSIGFYDGKNVYTFYLTDYNTPEEMIIEAFNELLRFKNNGYSVYFHNLQGFDGIILTQILENNFKVNSLFKDGKGLDVPVQKGIFPYKFVNENNLNYVGPKPELKFYENITMEEYNSINNN